MILKSFVRELAQTEKSKTFFNSTFHQENG